MAQKQGTVRAEIRGHGQYETLAGDLDELIEMHWNRPLKELADEVRERHGDPAYVTRGLARIELILIIAELDGRATN